MDDAQLSQRLAAIEAQLTRISQHLGLPLPPFPGAPGMPAYQMEVIALVRAGKKIEAIKVFREATGSSLSDAKDAVDRIA
jgi:hypothetical protein